MATVASADTVQAARRRFFVEGASPEGLVAAPILRSWQRCSSQGLDVGERPRVEPMSLAALREEQERYEILRRITRPEMTALRQEARLTDSVVILTDGDGLVLEMMGDTEFAGRASRVALRPGVAWNEAAIGTNAIGTALVERRAIGVHGAEHFFEPHRILTCAAAPIFNPRGQLAGVLDMSGHASVRHVHALGLVRLAVEQIEHRLFERGYETCAMLRFHEEADLVGTAREAILVFDGDRLVAGNQRGLSLVKLDWSALDKARLGDILETVEPSADVRPIRGHDGRVLHGRLTPPAERSARVVSAPAKLPSADAIEPVFDAVTLAALDRAARLVDAEVPVLIHGETGAGKEMFARRVHAASTRRKAPFIAVNCAALPESLIESELFGYEEGAFTGARRQGQPGLVRQADRGILFLDEIGDMPLATQGRLLRVLQERQVRPLGGGAPVPVDFALLCATHRPLATLVENGGFRQDLYFRIAQYVVELPALRDIGDLTGAIARLWSALGGDAIGVTLGEEALGLLAAYDWPGNFRQLAGLLRAMIALADPGRPLPVAALPDEIRSRAPRSPSATPPPMAPASDGSLSALTLEAMARAVEESGGNVSRAAKKLGIDRSTLYRPLIWRGSGPEPRPPS